MTKQLRVIGYVRVSTDRQEIGPEVQVAALAAQAAVRGWQLDLRREDAASAESLAGRPVLAQALEDLRTGQADMLAVSKLDRLSRSVADFARMLDDAERQGWHQACLDLDVDTCTIMGRGMAHIAAVFAEMERRISERTREGMATIKAQTGKHMGRPAQLDPATAARIQADYRAGVAPTAIARRLNLEGVPTANGAGKWWPGTVHHIATRA